MSGSAPAIGRSRSFAGWRGKPLREIVGQAGGAIEGRDDLAHAPRVGVRITAERPRQRLGQTLTAQLTGVNTPRQTMRCQCLGADLLLNLVRSAGHNHQRPRHGQRLAHAVVTPHAHDGVGSRHELEIVRV